MSQERLADEKRVRRPQAEKDAPAKRAAPERPAPSPGLAALQQQVGNRAVQRLLAQRSGSEPAELDEETEARINRARGGGEALDAALATQMGSALGQDLSGVRVHTSPEADSLNRRIGARAFTTGSDIFFRSGAYEPHTGSGRELIGHELTHVVQQSAGAAAGNGRMTVNPPGDAYELEADNVAKALAAGPAPGVQRDALAGEDEEALALPELEEEEQVQMQFEEEEQVQMQDEDGEDEEQRM